MDAPSRRIVTIGALALLAVLVASFVLHSLYELRLREQEGGLPVHGQLSGFSWTGTDGEPLGAEQLRGRVWCGYFFFTTCTGICIPMTQSAAELERQLEGLADVRIVGITCDPQTDTLPVLRRYAESHGLASGRVRFARGDFDAVQDFAQRTLRLGLEKATAEKLAQGAEKVMHSSRFFLVDAQLRLRGYYDGLDAEDVRRLASDMRRLAKTGAEQD